MPLRIVVDPDRGYGLVGLADDGREDFCGIIGDAERALQFAYASDALRLLGLVKQWIDAQHSLQELGELPGMIARFDLRLGEAREHVLKLPPQDSPLDAYRLAPVDESPQS